MYSERLGSEKGRKEHLKLAELYLGWKQRDFQAAGVGEWKGDRKQARIGVKAKDGVIWKKGV